MPARTRSASNTDVVSFTLHSKISKGAAGSIWSATVVLPNGSQACRAAKVIESEGDGDNLVDAKREIKAHVGAILHQHLARTRVRPCIRSCRSRARSALILPA